MLVILDSSAWSRWLAPDTEVDELRSMLAPAPTGTLNALVVSSRVNSPRNDDASLLESEF